jgi:hypothetical protein
VVPIVKLSLGTFACNGIEASLSADVAAGVRAALSDLTQRIDAGQPPLGVPRLFGKSAPEEPDALAMDLPVDEHTWEVLEREAARQGATVEQLAVHSVLIYLAELDRLTPADGAPS